MAEDSKNFNSNLDYHWIKGPKYPSSPIRTPKRKPLKERQQELANRLDYTNSWGNVLGTVFNMTEDLQNEATIRTASKKSLRDLRNYYGSKEYERRLRQAKVNMSNAKRLQDRLLNVKVYSVDGDTAKKMNSFGNGLSSTFEAMTVFKTRNKNGKLYKPGIYYNKGLMNNGLNGNVYGTFSHEYSHWADRGLTEDALAHNHSLIKGNLNPKLTPKEKSYYGDDTEIRARAMDVLIYYNNNKNKYKNFEDYLLKERDLDSMRDLRKTFKDEASFRNYLRKFVVDDNPGIKRSNIYYAKKGIHIKKKNRGKFTDYCGGKVTDACIRKAKASGNPTLVKRATFAANARKWKHLKGGILQNGAELGGLVGEAVKRVAKANAAKLWFESRYLPINWNNMKYIYNQMKLAGIPYDTTIAVMGNIIHESQGNPNKRQIGGGPGYGLIQWNKGTEPGDTLELQTQGIINNLINPSGLNNYWYHGGEGSGFKSGEDVRLYMNQKNNYEFSRKTKAFSDSLLRPGKPEMSDRIKSARSLAALQDLFPEYLKGGII